MSFQDKLESIPILGKQIKKNKLQDIAQKIKKEFLSTWTIEQLKDLCKTKGLIPTKIEVTDIALDNPNPERELDFNETVGFVAWKVSGKEITNYCEKNKFECENFKLAYKNITAALEGTK